eukprot:gene11465-11558_t
MINTSSLKKHLINIIMVIVFLAAVSYLTAAAVHLVKETKAGKDAIERALKPKPVIKVEHAVLYQDNARVNYTINGYQRKNCKILLEDLTAHVLEAHGSTSASDCRKGDDCFMKTGLFILYLATLKEILITLALIIVSQFLIFYHGKRKGQVNGGESPTCETIYKEVPFSDLNTAGRIWAGMDIINTLSEFYGVSAPIFLDNRESVSKIPDTQSQVINLKKLIQNYFIKLDAVLKEADRKRMAKKESNRDPISVTWDNLNMQKLAQDVISFSAVGLDPAQPNHINIIPYKNNGTSKYDITFIMGYRGIELKGKKYGLDIPDDDILKRRPDHASAEFWGGEKDKYQNGTKVGTEQVEGWFDEMCYKTIHRAAYNDITIDSEKIDEHFLKMIEIDRANDGSVAENVKTEISENAHKTSMDFDDAQVVNEPKEIGSAKEIQAESKSSGQNGADKSTAQPKMNF